MALEQEKAGKDRPEERRRHMRYRLQERLQIRRKDGTTQEATTHEISLSGLSISCHQVLGVGEEVRLFPVAGEQVSAVVRRSDATVHGMEFTELLPRVAEAIHLLCRGLIPFRSAADLREPEEKPD